jgi:hypothetical protein
VSSCLWGNNFQGKKRRQAKETQNGSSNYFGAFVLNFEHLNFDIVSDFDIRISDLLVTFVPGKVSFPKWGRV